MIYHTISLDNESIRCGRAWSAVPLTWQGGTVGNITLRLAVPPNADAEQHCSAEGERREKEIKDIFLNKNYLVLKRG